MKGCRPLTDEEVHDAEQSFGGRYAARNHALFVLGVKTGFRVSELLSLCVGDVYQYGHVVDHVTVERQHMKKKVEGRTVPLHPEAKEALAEWLAELQHDPRYSEDLPLFISRKGRKAISRVAAWRIMEEVWQVNEMTGKLGTHSLRKTFADRVHTRLNGDLLKTQRALGHRNVNSTVSYLSFREEEIEQAIITC